MYINNQEENNAIPNQRQGRYIMSSGQPDKNGSTKNNYKHISDIRNVIRYISRSTANSNSDDLVCYGAINANSRSIENTINDFESETISFADTSFGNQTTASSASNSIPRLFFICSFSHILHHFNPVAE